MFPVVTNVDIKQMYLRIGVSQDQRKYLRILFHFGEKDALRTFEFNRLPFGMKSSPYLAIRTIRQLPADEAPDYPEAASIVASHLYMDDLVYSVPDEEIAKRLSGDLVRLLGAGKFELIKWASNCN